MHVSGRGAEGEGQRDTLAGSTLSAEPGTVLDLTFRSL